MLCLLFPCFYCIYFCDHWIFYSSCLKCSSLVEQTIKIRIKRNVKPYEQKLAHFQQNKSRKKSGKIAEIRTASPEEHNSNRILKKDDNKKTRNETKQNKMYCANLNVIRNSIVPVILESCWCRWQYVVLFIFLYSILSEKMEIRQEKTDKNETKRNEKTEYKNLSIKNCSGNDCFSSQLKHQFIELELRKLLHYQNWSPFFHMLMKHIVYVRYCLLVCVCECIWK